MAINRETFIESSAKASDKSLREGCWEVWPEYGISHSLNQYESESFISARPTTLRDGANKEPERFEYAPRVHRALGLPEDQIQSKEEPDVYAPLVSYPGLFLQFARLADDNGLDEKSDTAKNCAVALTWARAYGTLGLTTVKSHGRECASTTGGRQDTVAAFVRESWIAHGALTLYEAATQPKAVDVETIASYIPSRQRDFFTQTPQITADWAVNAVAETIQEKVAYNAYPSLYGEIGRFRQGWDFKNLLSAMWLQMFFLLTAEEQPRYCKQCGRIITIERPKGVKSTSTKRNDRSAGYKTRVDREYCPEKCADRHYYLTVTKPKREAARFRLN